MRFQVPQFIELLGPLTFKQFIYIAGAIGIGIVLFTFLPNFLALLVSVPVLVFGVALAFYRVNDRPFIQVVEDFFHYTVSSKLYVWKKEDRKVEVGSRKQEVGKPAPQVFVPKLSDSKLKDLSWSLDIKENQNPITGPDNF